MPSPNIPPLFFPLTVEIPSVPRGIFGTAYVGREFNFVGDVVVRINGDVNGVFSVLDLETQALRVNSDPEGPTSSYGRHSLPWMACCDTSHTRVGAVL